MHFNQLKYYTQLLPCFKTKIYWNQITIFEFKPNIIYLSLI